MALIYYKVASGTASNPNKNTLVLNPRNAYIAKFDIGDWSRMRFAVQYSVVDDENPNAIASPTETFSYSNREWRNEFLIGIKRYNEHFPGESNNDCFIGYRNPVGNNLLTPSGYNVGVDLRAIIIKPNKSYQQGPTTLQSIGGSFSGYGVGTENYFSQVINGEIILANKGTNIQAAKIKASNGWGIGPYQLCPTYQGSNDMFVSMNTGALYSDTNFVETSLTNNGSPLPIPDAIYIYSPFYTARIRIHNVAFQRVE